MAHRRCRKFYPRWEAGSPRGSGHYRGENGPMPAKEGRPQRIALHCLAAHAAYRRCLAPPIADPVAGKGMQNRLVWGQALERGYPVAERLSALSCLWSLSPGSIPVLPLVFVPSGTETALIEVSSARAAAPTIWVRASDLEVLAECSLVPADVRALDYLSGFSLHFAEDATRSSRAGGCWICGLLVDVTFVEYQQDAPRRLVAGAANCCEWVPGAVW